MSKVEITIDGNTFEMSLGLPKDEMRFLEMEPHQQLGIALGELSNCMHPKMLFALAKCIKDKDLSEALLIIGQAISEN